MITDNDLEYVREEGVKGAALVWVIDGQCLYDLALNARWVQLFTSYDTITDVSSEYPAHSGIAVRMSLGGQVLEDFLTSEYFGSILLSDPLVLNLADYPYGRYVQSPNAGFDGTQFIIYGRENENLMPWYAG